MQAIQTDRAPAAIGPYSQAVQADGWTYISGQLGLDPKTGQLAHGFESQARQVFANLRAILEAGGLTFAHAVKVTVYLQDLNQFAELNRIYAEYFQAPHPAREAIQAARLPKDGLIEISLIARAG